MAKAKPGLPARGDQWTEAAAANAHLRQDASENRDTTFTLNIGPTRQRIRLRAARSGLPLLLIVQGGPGLPLLNEVSKFEQRLQLEQRFSVAYWEQRGCGN